MQIIVHPTEHIKDGYRVEEYVMQNDHGFEIKLSNFGCTLMNLFWPNQDGTSDDILLGYDRIEEWFEDKSFFGSTAGRCCNRIRDSKVIIGGQEYILNANIPPHQLHGGIVGFNKKMWRGYPFVKEQHVGVTMYYNSRHLEEGYPGNLSLEATIALDNKNQLIIEYRATTDAFTICNITTHPYFNLDRSRDILDHTLWIDADHVTEMDQDLLTNGKLISVNETPFDFRTPAEIRSPLSNPHQQIILAEGIDHNYVLNQHEVEVAIASLNSEINGRKISLFTNQPGIQLYTGNHLNLIGKNGMNYQKHAGICLETQGFPNAVNIESFPSVLLRPEEQYYSYSKIEMLNC